MTKKLFLVLPGLVLLSCSAGDVQANDTNTTSPNEVGTLTAAYNNLISKTTAYPDSYSQPADQQGTMTELPYNTRDYVNGARNEADNNSHPRLTSRDVDLSDYDNIFISTPIWWYSLPMPVLSFLEWLERIGF